MSCATVRNQIHDYIDRDLKSADVEAVEGHLKDCAPCRSRYREMEFLRQALAARTRFPQAARNPMWQRLRWRTGPGATRRWIFGSLDSFSAYLRGLDQLVVWGRLGAIPISAALMVLLATQISPLPLLPQFTRVSAPVFVLYDEAKTETVTVMDGWQHSREIDNLINVAGEVPHEDQLSVVADIDSMGRVDIGDVLVYPSSNKLYEAIGRSLRHTVFQPEAGERRMVYSFQKIEVFDTPAAKRGSF